MNQLTQEQKGKEAAWRESIERCDKCGCRQLSRHEDGVQCFNCNHIIYYQTGVAILSKKKKALKEQGKAMPMVTKPDNWNKLGNWAKRAWYNSHIPEILADYRAMSFTLVLVKWQMSGATLMLLRKAKGIPTKNRKRDAVVV